MSLLTPPRRRRTPQQQATNGRVDGKQPAPAKPKDPRLAALWRFAISITVFTTLGALWLGFEDPWVQPLVAVATSYSLELIFETVDAWSCKRKPRYRGSPRAFVEFLLPAHITALSVAFLLYPGSRIAPVVFAITVAACSKYILTVRVKGRRRHFMNPSNLGISVTLLLFPSVGIAPPYHFTENVAHNPLAWILPVFVIGAGTMLNAKLTKKWPLILGWVGGFVAQALVRSLLFGTPVVAPLLVMTGLVFWLYTNYMITDPGTTPMIRRNQFVFGATVAAVYGILVSLHVVFGLFFALTIVCAMRGLACALPGRYNALRMWLQPSCDVPEAV
jgi:hypothetical protein